MAEKKGCKRRKFPNTNTPDPAFQVRKRITEVGEKQIDVGSIRKGYAKKIQELAEELEKQCAPYNCAIEELVCEIFEQVEEKREVFTQGKQKKIIQFTTGAIRQRFMSSTNVFDEKKAVRWMKRHGLKNHIRRKVVEEVNKQSTNRNRKKLVGIKIPGLSIDYAEFFTVTPKITGVPMTLPIKYLKQLAKKTAKKKA